MPAKRVARPSYFFDIGDCNVDLDRDADRDSERLRNPSRHDSEAAQLMA